MSKAGTPWYRKSHESWYVWHQGKQVPLAKGRDNKAEAYLKHALLLGAVPPAPSVLKSPTVGRLIADYLVDAQRRISPATHIAYQEVLKPFVNWFGDEPAVSLKSDDIERWVSNKRWSRSTRRLALTTIGTAIRWSVRTGRLATDPIPDLRPPSSRSRGAEVLIDADLHAKILSVASPEFADFISAVRGTGARPGEVARVEAKDVFWSASLWRLTEHKTAKATGKDREIHLPDDVLEICKRLALKHPTGPLFRNTLGERWKASGWKQAMQRSSKKLGLEKIPLTSGYRHSFATRALEKGIPDAYVAALLGHVSTQMVHRHYGHLSSRGRALKEALQLINSDGPLPESSANRTGDTVDKAQPKPAPTHSKLFLEYIQGETK